MSEADQKALQNDIRAQMGEMWEDGIRNLPAHLTIFVELIKSTSSSLAMAGILCPKGRKIYDTEDGTDGIFILIPFYTIYLSLHKIFLWSTPALWSLLEILSVSLWIIIRQLSEIHP